MFLGWSVHLDIRDRCVADCSRYTFFIIPEVHGPLCVTNDLIKLCRLLPIFFVYISHLGRMSYFQPHNNTGQAPFCSIVPTGFPSRSRQSQPLGHKSPPDRLHSLFNRRVRNRRTCFCSLLGASNRTTRQDDGERQWSRWLFASSPHSSWPIYCFPDVVSR